MELRSRSGTTTWGSCRRCWSARLVGALAAFVVSLPSLRTRGHYFVILTFAIAGVAVVAMGRLEDLTGGLDGITVLPGQQTVFGLELADRTDFYILAVVIGVLVLLGLLAVMRSRWGATLRGIRENEELAAALGAPVHLHRILGFVLSGAVGGIAGIIYVYNVRFIAPSLFDIEASIFFLLMVLLGGRRYLLGPLVGAVVYVFLPHFIFLSPERSQMLLGIILIVMILLLPTGLLSLPSRTRQVATRLRDRTPTGADAPGAGPPGDGVVTPPTEPVGQSLGAER